MSDPARIPVIRIDDPDALAIAVAHRIAALIRERTAAGLRTVLGLATGSTPVGVYREFARILRPGGQHADDGIVATDLQRARAQNRFRDCARR